MSDQETWTRALNKGRQLHTDMLTKPRIDTLWQRVTDLTGPASLTLKEIEQGQGHGWSIFSRNSEVPDDFKEIFEKLEIPEANQVSLVRADDPFQNYRHENNEPIDGLYKLTVNIPGRLITAQGSFSPEHQVQANHIKSKLPLPPDWREHLPNVHRHSDVLWIMWKDAAKLEAGSLKYVFRSNIITNSTRRIIEMATLAEKEKFVAPWPGKDFYPHDADSSRFLALLGTSHGAVAVHMVMQHATELGSKNVEAIKVFTTGDLWSYHMMITLTG